MDPHLIIESESESTAHALRPDQVTSIGRNRANSIVLRDEHASRFHAEIICEDGKWILRNCKTMNGTRVNNQKIDDPVNLAQGDIIRIGDTRLRFILDGADLGKNVNPNPVIEHPSSSLADSGLASTHEHTAVETDELTALCSLLIGPVDEATPRAIVARALATIYQQTGANVVGFMSLDEEQPLPKIVYPELRRVDIHLSRQLTQQVQREGKRVWLGAGGELFKENDSLLSFTDALCIPLRASQVNLGALHVYKSDKLFADREVRFCEGVAGYLANSLHVLRSHRLLEAENLRLRSHVAAADEALIGDSTAMKKVRHQIDRLAPSQATVLIVGESGVGKELVALSIHRLSQRREAPLVTVNCAAIASNLMESELFGHRRGAFTSATTDRKGLFERADEGTLFLDEIGELSLECQAKLLRVIEGKGFYPLGSETEIKTDVRMIAATNRDLESQVDQRGFRRDLFFRLSITIRVPPLRDHAEDIPLLVKHFLSKLSNEYRRQFQITEAALDLLQSYSWPGNVRQLRSVLEYALNMCEGNIIDVLDLKLSAPSPETGREKLSLNLEELEAWAIGEALKEMRGNLSKAAKILGIHRDTLSMKMKKYGIERPTP
ncbi:MAG TPA: sigma 54-interacting transcriptional regulator [Gemmataceae bacterium]|nr:sigma 54-interacting transcriptional regulator [Gemmataceae bacterium]